MRMHFSALRGINRTAWGTGLLLTAAMAHPVDCTSAGPILWAQRCCLSPNGRQTCIGVSYRFGIGPIPSYFDGIGIGLVHYTSTNSVACAIVLY